MRQLTLWILLGAFIPTIAQETQHRNLTNGVAIMGYDPVTYFTGKPVKGDKSYSFSFDGAVYYFSSASNLAIFKANPNKYEPQYGGWCAFAMGDYAKKVSVNPETFKIVDGKLYLFYNANFTNTLKSWNKDEINLMMKADKNWNLIITHK